MSALKPYRGKPAVRNFRGDDGDVGIIRSPVRAIALPGSQSFQSLTAIAILHNFADEVYGSEPDGCARFFARIHGSLRTALNNPIAALVQE
jgi:hypothetical protein